MWENFWNFIYFLEQRRIEDVIYFCYIWYVSSTKQDVGCLQFIWSCYLKYILVEKSSLLDNHIWESSNCLPILYSKVTSKQRAFLLKSYQGPRSNCQLVHTIKLLPASYCDLCVLYDVTFYPNGLINQKTDLFILLFWKISKRQTNFTSHFATYLRVQIPTCKQG